MLDRKLRQTLKFLMLTAGTLGVPFARPNRASAPRARRMQARAIALIWPRTEVSVLLKALCLLGDVHPFNDYALDLC
jgi:hypothetical protein